ncbi:MAG: SMC-Scp complex subunit ScpB [Solirubrobacteraceae bacterium]|nr:SMC-Scp complex subunit ScpB [Solirubrobacteraceae bacterium]
MNQPAKMIEALLFVSPQPVNEAELAEAIGCELDEVTAGLEELGAAWAEGERGMVLRKVAGGYTLASAPENDEAARRLLSKPRTPPLTPAQAETLAIVAYLQPVSRPEITRIRGVSADSASGTLLERGLIEESGRSQFGAICFRTTDLFLKLFGLSSIGELPPISEWDPSPEEQSDLRERLMAAGGARLGEAPTSEGEEAMQQPLPQIETEAEAELDESGDGGAAGDSEGDQPANAFAAN